MGPLQGIKVVEIAGLGAAPFCAMMLSDMGAEVIRVDRLAAAADLGMEIDPRFDLLNRGRRSVAINLKSPGGVATAKRLIQGADALIEGFRPGVMERLGLGPAECLALNRKLVYGRMTGWGQDGPMAQAAGHDINYIALAGALHCIGRKGEAPVPPLNLIGDLGGGALYLAFGIVCALLEARRSGEGQVVDAAMIDGAASLLTFIYGMKATGDWSEERGDNVLDSGAPWYDVYQTSDNKYVSIGPIEARFYGLLLEKLGLSNQELPEQNDRSGWPELRRRFAAVIKGRTRAEWCASMEGSDACFAPVLTPTEAAQHPHNKQRDTFIEVDGIVQPAPAPRFSRTKPAVQRPPARPGEHTETVLLEWGFIESDIAGLRAQGAIA